MTTTENTKAFRLPEGADIDILATFPVATVKGASLKPGMVLLDEFNSPAAVIDHRAGSKGGTIRFLVNDLEKGGWTEARIGENAAIKVAAR